MISNLYNALFQPTSSGQGQAVYYGGQGYQTSYQGQCRRPRQLPQLPMRPLPLSPSRYRRYHCKSKTLGPHYEPSIFRREFILDLLWELFQGNSNLVFSPYALQSALTALLPGLNGETRDQIVRVLYSHYLAREFFEPQALADKIVEQFAAMNNAICVRNAAYLQQAVVLYSDARCPKLNPHFVSALRANFEATGKELNFCNQYAACQTINSDVYLATGGSVRDVVKPEDIGQFTDLILVCAMFFKGRWTRKSRVDVPFYVKSSQFKLSVTSKSIIQITVPFVYNQRRCSYYYDAELRTKTIMLDFDRTCGANVSLLMLLPDDGFASITAYVKNILSTRAFERILASLAPAEVNLSFPKFRIELKLPDLIGPLTNLGIRDLFDRTRADLDRIVPTATMPPRVIVTKLIQKVVIEVNEEGTDPLPSAGQSAQQPPVSRELANGFNRQIPPKQFHANRPFVFALVTKGCTQEVLLMGVVCDPRPVHRTETLRP